ncbi:trypsin-like cysteine/serine peptidase domain-containing protein [Rhypophila decipiens]|uniref:Serine protease n=1 Tax=Rhypophila decipiens TaxID=261697 RepID=A0AAN6YCD9_9PEZI|nr:trypsin-like cysteine/serine peptidase domain-containing protein [Rhypophila decipiens]
MVHLSPVLAASILAFTSSALAVPTVEWTHPILKVPITPSDGFKTAAVKAAPAEIAYTEADLASFHASSIPGAPLNATLSARDEESLSARGIIGPDNRVLWTSTDYPYSAIGRVSLTGAVCSGSMVGRRLVATAKHCQIPAGGSGRFAPSYYDGERLGGSNVVAVISMAQGSGSCNQKEDWAIFVLADPIGDQTGYLGAKVIDCDAQKNRAMFFHQGYPGDKGASRPYRQEAISVSRCADCEPGGPLETDADAVPGQSGGPLWLFENGSRFVYGVASGTSSIGTGFASGANFVNAIARARQDFP